MTQTDTDTTTESDGVLDTLEQKMDAFEEYTGLDPYTQQTTVAKGVALYMLTMFSVGPAAAQSGLTAVCGSSDNAGLSGFLQDLIGLLIAVGFIGAVYAMVRSGLKFMNSGGDPEKKSSARESLMMSFTGIGIVLFVTFLPEFLNSLVGTSLPTCFLPF
jgi:hypothetical protein